MTRDVSTALSVALILIALVSAWVFFNARSLADPQGGQSSHTNIAALPLPPMAPNRRLVADRMLSVLSERDIFTALDTGEDEAASRLRAAQVAPPVRLDPVAAPSQADRTPAQPQAIAAVPQQPARVIAPAPSQQPAPQYIQPRQPGTFVPGRQTVSGQPGIRLRGVVPHPIDGVRALLSMPDGQVVTAALGNQVGGWQIVRIGRISVVLVSPTGQALELRLQGY